MAERNARASASNASTFSINAGQARVAAERASEHVEMMMVDLEAFRDEAEEASTMAKASEFNASASATKAESSATNASSSESNASSYKTSAKLSETNASTYASNASKSETNAKAAMNSAVSASTSANTSATNASTSASNAAKSEAEVKKALAEAIAARDAALEAVTKLTGVMKYAGQVTNYSELANKTKNAGDVWNIVNVDKANGIKAGDNVVWNGSAWDNLSGFIDLTAYALKTDLDNTLITATFSDGFLKLGTKQGTTLYVEIEESKGAAMAMCDLNGNIIHETYETRADASNVHDSLQKSINTLSTGKQDKLVFDTTPTLNSNNPVTSDGIKKAIDAKTVDLSGYPTKTEVDDKIDKAISAIADYDSATF